MQMSIRAAVEDGRGLVVCARGEQLPFRDSSISHVGSGVALPYMFIPVVVKEVFRVLCPGGSLRISLHPWTMTASELLHALRHRNLRNTLFRCYILLNGLYFHLTGRLFRFPLKRARCESFQTKGRITRCLVSAGFNEIRSEISPQFVIQAVKPL